MTDYDALGGRLNDIAEAAIDWRMQIMGWGKSGDSWSKTGLSDSWQVDREGNVVHNGEAVEDPYFRDMMNGWRTTVPEVLEPWTELPDPAWLDSRLATLRTQMNSLLDPAQADVAEADPAESSVPELGNGPLHNARQSIEAEIGKLSGETAAQMREVLVFQLDDVMRGEFAAAGVLGLHLEGQQQILKKAREDVVALVDGIYEVFDNYGAVGGPVDLGVVGALVGLVGSFATGGLATALGVIGAAVGLADALLPEGSPPNPVEVELGGIDPEESWANLVDGLTRLNESITDQERDLAGKSRSAAATVSGSAKFDLSRVRGEGSDPGTVAADPGTGVLGMDYGALTYIAENSLVTASHGLDQTRYDIEDVDPSFALSRPGSIGYTSHGIEAEWRFLRDSVVTAIGGTAGELWELRAAVIEVLHRFGVTDVEQAERYRDLEPSLPAGCHGY